MGLVLSSTAFGPGTEIPRRYTCDGLDISPPLAWTGVPDPARSLCLIVEDPDAPDPAAPRMTWVHWVLFNLPPSLAGLAEGVESQELPAGVTHGFNDWQLTGYKGPCPPRGRHRYFFKLFALDTELPGLNRPTKAMVEQAMAGHVLAQIELVGLYQRSG